MPRRGGRSPARIEKSPGSANDVRIATVQTAGVTLRIQPAARVRKAAGAESERRRLSTTFQRPIAGMGFGVDRREASGTRGSSQGRGGQSPRTKGCCRDAANP